MEAPQSNKLAMFASVIDLLDDSTDLIATIPALSAALTSLRAQADAIPVLAGAQAQPTSGATADKQAALDAMAEAALAVSASALSYASQHHLGDLAAKVRVTASALSSGREQDRLTLAQQIHSAASTVAAQLADFGVTPADLDDLQTKITTARTALNAPRAVAGAKKSATQQLIDAFRAADDMVIMGVADSP